MIDNEATAICNTSCISVKPIIQLETDIANTLIVSIIYAHCFCPVNRQLSLKGHQVIQVIFHVSYLLFHQTYSIYL